MDRRGDTIAKAKTVTKPAKAVTPTKAVKTVVSDKTAGLSAALSREFKTGARKRSGSKKRVEPRDAPRAAIDPNAEATGAASGVAGSLKYRGLAQVRGRRVEVVVSRDSRHGSFTRGDVFLITGKDGLGWTIRGADAQGQPAGRACSRVHPMMLRLLEEAGSR